MSDRPVFLDRDPVELRFGTSGLRGLVRDMTDLEVYINVQGFLRYLALTGQANERDPVVVGQDLRAQDPSTGLESSPRIARTAMTAVKDVGHPVINAGQVPTPALAAYASAPQGVDGADASGPIPALMVTGSHIPPDRNGVKFYRPTGEVLKSDEPGIIRAVGEVRRRLYAMSAEDSRFDARGMFKTKTLVPAAVDDAARAYMDRYLAPFEGGRPLAGQRVLVYQHSSVARDLLSDVLTKLGADAIPIERTDAFVAVDTEDVSVADEARYRQWIDQHRADALVSTDGDGDRPLVVDETGRFHRGDVVGIVCAEFIGAGLAAVPVSATDAIERHFSHIDIIRTRIGSPYVIDAMNTALARGAESVVGWEANGGFLTATPFRLNTKPVRPLPTRDAFLPIICVLLASRETNSVSGAFARLPQRATRAGLIDNFHPDQSRALLASFYPADATIQQLRFTEGVEVKRGDDDWASTGGDHRGLVDVVRRYFSENLGVGRLVGVNLVDGVRMYFESGEIVHLRPSGNAPQFRVYTVADTQARADQLNDAAVSEPDGILRRMERDLGI